MYGPISPHIVLIYVVCNAEMCLGLKPELSNIHYLYNLLLTHCGGQARFPPTKSALPLVLSGLNSGPKRQDIVHLIWAWS